LSYIGYGVILYFRVVGGVVAVVVVGVGNLMRDGVREM